MAGRFAPSPTGDLHVGNLRTALVAWLAARSTGRDFIVRMEDLDRVTSSAEHERRQLADLAAIGLDWDGEVVRQSDRFDRYRTEIERLRSAGYVYECFCTRREIRREIDAAASAPHDHLPDGAYPGTCRDLSRAERADRAASGRTPALRLRTDGQVISIDDRVVGRFDGAVDDVVLARADGVPAYNLAVVVDDIAQGVDQVVRGDDLLSSTPRQVLLYRLLGASPPEYWHVPLVLGADGARLAKRHGAVTLEDLSRVGVDAESVVDALVRSLGLVGSPASTDLRALATGFTADAIRRSATRFDELGLPDLGAHGREPGTD
ncbi:MAG: tRNA glutamyl-Q(34) synthetase GluQRS [Ilumatobacteraceae bacterium]